MDSDGCEILLELSGRDIALGNRILVPGCHVEYENETYTILDIRQEGFPKFFILTLDRDFPKENYKVFNMRNEPFYVNGDLQGNQLTLFYTKCDHDIKDYSRYLIQNNKRITYMIKSWSYHPKRPKHFIAEALPINKATLEQTYNLVLPERQEVF